MVLVMIGWMGKARVSFTSEFSFGVYMRARSQNINQMAVSVKRGGIIQKPPDWHDALNPHILAVEDPQEANRNIGVNSHNMAGVKEAMREASEALSRHIGDHTGSEREAPAQSSQVFPTWRSLAIGGASLSLFYLWPLPSLSCSS